MKKGQINPIKLSVIIPNFNSGKYLEEAIQSIVKQKYDCLELIVIDGMSEDNSLEIIKNYQQHIAYWISEIDTGQADAINKGIKVASGDYIAFLNADDAYVNNSFEYVAEILVKENLPDFIFGNVRIGSTLHNSKVLKNRIVKDDLQLLLNFYLGNRYIIPSQSVFIKREFLIRNNLTRLNDKLHYCMDFDWYCKVFSLKPKVKKYSKVISFFRITPETKTSKNHKEMQQEANSLAFLYLPLLNKIGKKRFFFHRYFSKFLYNIYQKKMRFSIPLCLHVIYKSGGISLLDKRFWGIIKSNILS